MPLLHGVLHVHVHEACDIATTARIQTVGFLKKYVCCGMLPDLAGSCDPYFCLDVGNTRRLRTRFIHSTHNPVWNEKHEVYLADEANEIKIEVKVSRISQQRNKQGSTICCACIGIFQVQALDALGLPRSAGSQAAVTTMPSRSCITSTGVHKASSLLIMPLLVYLQDADVVGADYLGEAVIPVSDILGGQVLDRWYELTDSGGNVRYHKELDGDQKPSRVHVTMQFVPVGAEVRPSQHCSAQATRTAAADAHVRFPSDRGSMGNVAHAARSTAHSAHQPFTVACLAEYVHCMCQQQVRLQGCVLPQLTTAGTEVQTSWQLFSRSKLSMGTLCLPATGPQGLAIW